MRRRGGPGRPRAARAFLMIRDQSPDFPTNNEPQPRLRAPSVTFTLSQCILTDPHRLPRNSRVIRPHLLCTFSTEFTALA